MDTIFQSSICELEELKDIFIELTAKNCNIRCHNCYIDFPITKNIKDFIKVDTVKTALLQLKDESIRCIYLTGAEPMTHPDFNAILRLCIKKSDVCICTNGSFINEKKARFLKLVEAESSHSIMFRLSFTHWDEIKNDYVRSRGAFRQNIYALKCLDKYDFTNIITISNYYKEPHNKIVEEFGQKLTEIGVENAVIQVNEWYSNSNDTDFEFCQLCKPDCISSRTLTENGVFSCPFLANDYRGRMGSDFSDYSKVVRLETPYCQTCIKNNDKMFTVEF